MKKLVLIVGLLVAFSASAKDCEKESEGGGAVAWRECIATQNQKPMDDAYNALIKVHGGNEEAINAVKESQDAWTKFKYATCGYIEIIDSREAGAVCADEFTKARVKILNQYAKQVGKK